MSFASYTTCQICGLTFGRIGIDMDDGNCGHAVLTLGKYHA